MKGGKEDNSFLSYIGFKGSRSREGGEFNDCKFLTKQASMTDRNYRDNTHTHTECLPDRQTQNINNCYSVIRKIETENEIEDKLQGRPKITSTVNISVIQACY